MPKSALSILFVDNNTADLKNLNHLFSTIRNSSAVFAIRNLECGRRCSEWLSTAIFHSANKTEYVVSSHTAKKTDSLKLNLIMGSVSLERTAQDNCFVFALCITWVWVYQCKVCVNGIYCYRCAYFINFQSWKYISASECLSKIGIFQLVSFGCTGKLGAVKLAQCCKTTPCTSVKVSVAVSI